MKKNNSKSRLLRSVLRIFVSIAVISISAQLTIDIGAIPITGQTLAILCVALLNIPRDTFTITIGYLLLGVAGLPLFADASFGIEKLTGNSGGYLLGFVVSATLISYLFDRLEKKTMVSIFLLTFLGTATILALGVLRLSYLLGIDDAILYGFNPFWVGGLVKIVIGTLITFGLLRFMERGVKIF